MENKKTFNDLKTINVNDKIEKKGSLSYLSWSHAVDSLMSNDPMATWIFPDPKQHPDQTVMVYCNVTAFGKTIPMHLPVMDNRNNAIKNPDARKISDAMMRCLTKCIACFGIGLYIYAGEDLPESDDGNEASKQPEQNWSMKQFDGGEPQLAGGPVYRIPFGKFKMKTLEEVGPKDLENYVIYLEEKAKKDGKEIQGQVKHFIDEATSFINAFEQEVNDWENFKK